MDANEECQTGLGGDFAKTALSSGYHSSFFNFRNA
jgi:hypothetical protein